MSGVLKKLGTIASVATQAATTLTHPLGLAKFGAYVSSIKLGKRGREEQSLPDDVQRYAVFADSAYKSGAKRRRTQLSQLRDPNEQHNWVYDTQLSDNLTAVYASNDKVVTSFRGTKPNEFEDLAADLLLAVGSEKHSKRIKRAERKMEQILEKYQEHGHILAGHSLGGSINLHLVNKYGDRIEAAHNYNPGASVSQISASLHETQEDHPVHKVHSYHIVGDPISHINRTSEHTEVYEMLKGTANPHSIQQFIN